MPIITDWLMVIITGIYVIATIIICFANLRSAKATREQLSEMKREHDEDVRLNIMPYLEVNFNEFDEKKHKFSPTVYTFSNIHEEKLPPGYTYTTSYLNLKNVGMNLATLISLEVQYANINEKRYLSGITIHSGVENHIMVLSEVPPSDLCDASLNDLKFAKITLRFDDIRGNHYLQTVNLAFKIYSSPTFLSMAYILDSVMSLSLISRLRNEASEDKENKKCYIVIYNCITEPPVFLKEKEA